MKRFAVMGMALAFGALVAVTFQLMGYPLREYLVIGLVAAGSFLLGLGAERGAHG